EGALLGQRREQGPFTGEVGGVVHGVKIQYVVFDPHDVPAASLNMAAESDALGMGSRGLIERPSSRCSPVGEERVMIGVGKADPPDVAQIALEEVESA